MQSPSRKGLGSRCGCRCFISVVPLAVQGMMRLWSFHNYAVVGFMFVPTNIVPTRKALMREHILAMLTRIMDIFVLPLLANSAIILVIFDLWMSWCGFDVIFLVVNFVDDECVPQDVTIGIFKVADMSRMALAEVIKRLLS